jgi:hypothetical protein
MTRCQSEESCTNAAEGLKSNAPRLDKAAAGLIVGVGAVAAAVTTLTDSATATGATGAAGGGTTGMARESGWVASLGLCSVE